MKTQWYSLFIFKKPKAFFFKKKVLLEKNIFKYRYFHLKYLEKHILVITIWIKNQNVEEKKYNEKE